MLVIFAFSIPESRITKKIGSAIKDSTIIGLGLAGVAGYWLFSKYTAGKNLVFSPGNVTSANVVNTNPTLQFQILAQNTAGTGLSVNSVAANLFSNGTLIGNVYNFLQVPVAANASTPIPLTATLLPLGIVNDLIQAFSSGNASQELELQGSANVNGFQVPLDIKFNVGL